MFIGNIFYDIVILSPAQDQQVTIDSEEITIDSEEVTIDSEPEE